MAATLCWKDRRGHRREQGHRQAHRAAARGPSGAAVVMCTTAAARPTAEERRAPDRRRWRLGASPFRAISPDPDRAEAVLRAPRSRVSSAGSDRTASTSSVNNAGAGTRAVIEDVSEEALDETLQVDLKAAVLPDQVRLVSPA